MPHDEPTNADRVERARAALEHYKAELLGEGGAHDFGTLVDLLTDLRHLLHADPGSLDDGGPMTFESAVDLSKIHFDAEIEEA